MVEFRKSEATDLGIDWQDSAAGPTYALAGDAVSSTLFRPPGARWRVVTPCQLRSSRFPPILASPPALPHGSTFQVLQSWKKVW